ncbi:MAG TPA: glycosyltransferase family 4 protein [Syntrophomonas sp.]|nr:glycosyltransferase family 4 protein [Syntrophomonas sp.]HCF70395.1 glycosyltransferase family 4 protein [Syntrophomonas sp.]
MKIGIFTDSYKPYTSGVVTSIATFRQELTRMGHDIYVFAPSYPHYNEKEDRVYRFFSFPSPTNPDYTLAIPVHPGMNLLVKKIDLDLIHVHSPFTMGRVGLHYARRYRLPLVFTYHTMYDQYVHYVPVAQELAKEVTIKYSNNFCNQCDHIIAPGTEVKEMLNRHDIRTPISVIPTGVPIEKFNGGDSSWLNRNFHIPLDNKVLLFVGRLTKEKNLEFLIQAFAQVKAKNSACTLVLTAQGPLEAQLKKLVQEMGLSLEHDVVFTGALPFDDLINVYYSADLFVFSSVTETQGLVLIEAMAAGLPVVAVRANGVNDMVDNKIDGILTGYDQDEFAGAICQVLADDAMYQSLKLNARRKAESLSSANMAQKLEDIYLTLNHSSRRRHHRLLDVGSWFGS